MIEQDMPIVFFDIVPKSNAFTKVRMADERCGVLAAKNIIKRNAKKVLAIFGDPALSISQIRKTSFQNLMMDLSPKTNVKYINATSSIEAEEIFKKNYNKTAKLDTVFCMTDEILIGVMRAIQELQIKVPTEMGVISISNGFIPNLYFPVISYVETSGFQLGKLAFTQMMANLQTGKPVDELTVEAKLIEGGSM
jgi:LacI family transcriptional regulator